MNKSIVLFLTLFVFGALQSLAQQQVLFMNAEKNKIIPVRPGHKLAVSYIGYNGVKEFANLTVTDITQDRIIMGVNPERFGLLKRKNDGTLINSYKEIKISDIVAFRRITPGRQFLKSLMRAGIYVGSFVMIYNLSNNTTLSAGQTFGVSLGVGVGSFALLELLFPEKTKYRMADGWKTEVVFR